MKPVNVFWFTDVMALKTVIVRWTGPFSLYEVCKMSNGNGLYLLTGRSKYERKDQIQYCGITEGPYCQRINEKHHKLGLIREATLSIWLGEVTYPTRFKRPLLERAEHCFVSFWQCPLNDRKTRYYPAEAVCFVSEWFTREGEPRRNRPPIMNSLPDVLWWDESRWRTGKLTVHPDED